MTDPPIPSSSDPISVGIANLVALRPKAVTYAAAGRYSHIFQGWQTQAAVLIARLADEVFSSRLPTATGDALRSLVASEFDVPTGTDGRATAVGTSIVFRAGSPPSGTLSKGTRFRRVANPNLSPPIQEAIYQVTEDIFFPSVGPPTEFDIPFACTQPGSVGNIIPDDKTFSNSVTTPYQWIDPIFDPTIPFVFPDAGGGAEITIDDDLRRAARAMAQGRNAPIAAALVAFALRGLGVRRVAVFDDSIAGIARLVIADGSRNGSVRWANTVKQFLYDTQAVGFGCRISCVPAILTWVAVQATIVLRDSNYLNLTADISTNVRAALDDYFGERDDWWIYRTPALRGVIARSDPRILTCTSVTVTTANGLPLTDPPVWFPGLTVPQNFWTLANKGLLPTYLPPF